jgi:hypothetical protein
MAMAVNLAFLVPQAMMNGLTKLGRWVSSGCVYRQRCWPSSYELPRKSYQPRLEPR